MDSLAGQYGEDWWFQAQHAFALVETGQRDAARAKIERSLHQYPRNAHGTHVRAHVHYEDGEQDAARAYLQAWLPYYPREGQLHCHIAWHLALCALEAGDTAAAYGLYRDSIAPDATWGPPLNALTDAVSFLWRAELAGGERDPALWRVVHDFAHRTFPAPAVAFADLHAALADAVAGDGAALDARVRRMEEMARAGRFPSGPVVPAISRGFAAFLRGEDASAIAAFEPVMVEHERAGGSRAQRDLVTFTLLRAYTRAGRVDDVRGMLSRWRTGQRALPVAGLPAG